MNRQKYPQQNNFTIDSVHARFKEKQRAQSEVVHFFLFFAWLIGVVIWFALEFIAEPGLLLALWWIPVFGGLGTWMERRKIKKDCERITGNDN